MKIGYLYDAAFIRWVLVFFLVLYHAFAPFSGAWAPIDSYPEIRAYWWFDNLCYACLLEAFVFVSGYTFGFQRITRGEAVLDFGSLFRSKFKRLIIPCMVFSLLYILLFQDIHQPLGKTIYGLFNGVGHLWFLPMLFWCFFVVWIVEKLSIKPHWTLILALVSAIFSFLSLPLEIGRTMYYFLFFYTGYLIKREEISLEKYNSVWVVILLAISFAVLFPLITVVLQHLQNLKESDILINKAISALCNICKMIRASAGLLLLFFSAGLIVKNKKGLFPSWIVNVGGLCMGIYIFQQFILKALYYYTTLPKILSHYWLPWVGFAVAFVFSALFTYLLRLTKAGRFIIG